jgi:hypothetical protein
MADTCNTANPHITSVPDLIREAKRLLLLANRDRHALPADGELSAARYLLDRALVLLEFDAATVPEQPTHRGGAP